MVRVTFRVELVFPTVTVPKFIEPVESVTGAVPVPERLTVCGLFPALSEKVKVPEAEPDAAGENVTPTVQCPPGARLALQLLLAIANGGAVVTEAIDKTMDCALVSVTVLDELVAPTTTVLKLKLPGDTDAGTLPFPLRFTVCGLVNAESVNVSTPVTEPSAVGVNVMLTVHVPPAATLVPQVFAETANGPFIVTPLRLSVPFRRLVNVTVLGTLVSFSAILPKLRLEGDKLTGLLPLPDRLTV